MHFKIIPILFLLLFSSFLFAQDELRQCHTMEADAALRARYPQLGSLDKFENWLAPRIRSFQKEGDNTRAISTIPIVFHIIHDGEAIGNGDNLSAIYIDAQIQQLNNDFRRILGSSGYNTDPVGADVEIEFCAATIDPDNNTLAEPGINRIDRNTAGWSAPPFGTCFGDNFNEAYIENTVKPQSQWDPDQYLNVWVMDIECGILGYAQFPSTSGLSGVPSNGGPASTDGVVLLSTSIGSTEIPQPGGGPYNKGRTATHEIGHFFGLRHIWGDEDCGTDYCADTPEAEGPAGGCPTSTTCDNQRDMVENYMDYSYDNCMNIFTADQKARMQTVLLNSPRRGALTNSTACTASGGSGLACSSMVSTYPYQEDFEDGLGVWRQSAVDDANWTTGSGSTPSENTGPNNAAMGNSYIYLESSSPNYPSKASVITSSCFDLSEAANATLTFQYHLFGADDMGGLELQAEINGSDWTSLWSVSGNQGNAWQSASVDLTTYLGDTIKLRYVGTTGTTWQGDIAIDNISLFTDTEANSSVCTDGISTFPYSESMETDFGAWSQNITNDFNWIRNTRGTLSNNTGPRFASDGNWYAYIESSAPNYPTQRAILNGPCFDLSSSTEAFFSFQYHMYGASNMGGLVLEARRQDGNWSELWSESGNQGNSWQDTSVSLSTYLDGSVELRFVGTTGTTWQGDIAIDDFQLTTNSNDDSATCTDILLAITFDNYPEETSWQFTDASGVVIANGGPYSDQADGASINLQGCFFDGCYDFTIFDSYGDGMCCTYGNGSYSLTDADGNVLAAGNTFGASETTNFCLPAGTRQATATSRRQNRESLQAFPNPTRDHLTVAYESKENAEVNWRILDLLGKTVQSAKWTIDTGENRQRLRVDHLPAGTYLVVIEHNGQPHTQRFVISR